MKGERSCVLGVIGANFQGEKEWPAVRDGCRESEQSGKELPLELKGRGWRGARSGPSPTVRFRFWKALPPVYPTTRRQPCWVHQTAKSSFYKSL